MNNKNDKITIKCANNDPYSDSPSLGRPEHTAPCGENFNIKIKNIFIRENNVANRYFILCPYCGYMVNINNNLLSDEDRNFIEEKCLDDNHLFQKNYLYSELCGIQNKFGGKRLIKTKKIK